MKLIEDLDKLLKTNLFFFQQGTRKKIQVITNKHILLDIECIQITANWILKSIFNY